MKSPVAETMFISKDKSLAIRGLMAIAVIIHHAYQYGTLFKDVPIIGVILQSLGYLAVSTFFFLSGYGMMKSYGNKMGGKLLIFNKVFPVFVLNILIVSVYYITHRYLGLSYRIDDLIGSFFIGNTITHLGWYIQVYILLVLFYGVSLITFKNSPTIALFSLTTTYMSICIVLGLGTYWYETTFCFGLGVLFAVKSTLKESSYKLYVWHIMLFFALFGVSKIHLPVLSLPCKILTIVQFPIILCSLSSAWIERSHILKSLGKRSFELYIMQEIPIILLPLFSYIESYSFFFSFIVISIACSYMIHPLFQRILSIRIKK